MTAPLDEARLRELADELRVSWSDRGWVAAKKISGLLAEAREAATGLDALLDALSAERERGDKAVGLLPDLYSVIHWLENGCDPKHAANELRIYRARVEAFLATQKAEGATSGS